MTYLEVDLRKPIELQVEGNAPQQLHLFDEVSVDAINAAIAARRPLLVRGEPGTGKTQLARAAAKQMGWAFVSTVIDSLSEAGDLLYQLDAVSRLGEAQIVATLKETSEVKVRQMLAESRFIKPGPVWWAFDWKSAMAQAKIVEMDPPFLEKGCNPEVGCVLLIDEIDKADADLPNGLLEAFGSGRFQVPGITKAICRSDKPLLVMITTNEERALPDAFLRRCLVLQLKFPSGTDLQDFFVQRAKVHFKKLVSEKVLQEAANQVVADREFWLEKNLAAPGLAEYLDLVRALAERGGDEETQLALLKRIKKFVLKKHPGA